jgi:hypothetical protein
VLNNPLKYTDPTGHCISIDGEHTCGSGNTAPRYDPPKKNKKDKDDEDSSGIDLYVLGWENAGQAWTIVSNPNASFGQRFGASAYLTGWVGFGHIGLAAGSIGLGCAALIAGCGTALGTGGPILIQGFARGGSEWHVGLETVENMNIIHIGNTLKFEDGIHIAFGAVKPFAADLHMYFIRTFPFLRTWRP